MKRRSLVVAGIPLALICLVLAIRYGTSTRCYRQKTGPMSPTIKIGDFICVDLSAYAKSNPRRWDVVLFHPPAATKADSLGSWDMRVIGLPGESVSIQGDGIYIDGKRLIQPPIVNGIRYETPKVYPAPEPDISYPYTVPADSYFVLGDNTSTARDSRFWGAVPRQNILGKVIGK